MLKLNNMIQTEAIFSAFTKKLEKHFYFAGERHNFWELVYVVSGSVCVAEDEKIYELHSGDIIFHMPMEFHRLQSAGNTEPTVIILSFSASGSNFNKLGNGIFKLNKDLENTLQEILNTVKQCLIFDDDIKNQFVSNSLEYILLTLLRKQIPESMQKKTIGTSNYKNIIKVMNENIEGSLSANQIAELCGLSLSNLKKIFKTYSGMGVMEYFNSMKIVKAMSMINEDIPICEISERLGYSSPNYFSYSFKRQCRITPMLYKKNYCLKTLV